MYKKILKKIKPSKEEEKIILNKIDEVLSNIKIKDAEAILGGSGAKRTWLKGTHDIDIFVKFDYNKYKNKNISKILEKELEKKFKITKVYGSRNYYQIIKGNFTFEIVPVFNVKKASEAKNITDVSPLHAKWVKKHSNEKLLDEIKLTKAFFKTNKLYGAESFIKGFSGYVLEILIIYYGSFNKLVSAIKKWKKPVIIDIEKHGSAKTLNISKKSPLILIDPVQPDRNAAAALSEECFNKIVKLANKKISFKEKKINSKDYNLILKAVPNEGRRDIIGAQLLKIFEFIKYRVNKKFGIIKSNWEWDEKDNAIFYYKTKVNLLPEQKLHYGPPLTARKIHIESFKKKYKKYKIKNKKLSIILPVKYRKINDFVKNLLKERYIKEKIKKIS